MKWKSNGYEIAVGISIYNLTGVAFVPLMRRSLICLSRLGKLGISCTYENRMIISYQSRIIGSGILSNGFYKISLNQLNECTIF